MKLYSNPLLILSLFSIIIICSCRAKEEKELHKEEKTLIIGHRSTGTYVNDGFLENTLPAIKEALKYIDGVEADIQMSASGTPWIYHDDLFNHLCDDMDSLLKANGYTCIINTPDSIIKQIQICRDGTKEHIYKLEDLFIELAKDKSKISSLDIKGYYDSSCVSTNNITEEYLSSLAKAIYRLAKKYKVKNQIIAETNYEFFFKKFKELDQNLQCHYMIYKNLSEGIDFALSIKVDGLTINMHDESFSLEEVERAKAANLKIQLWTIANEEHLKTALEYQPFAIQLSNLDLIRSYTNSPPLENKNLLQH